MDPQIEQFCRAHDFRIEWVRGFQRYLRDIVQSQLDQIEPLQLENEKLREELATLRAAQPEKRKRGRPRKVQPEEVAVGV